MNVKDLQALVVLRNHAQSLLNGLRADLKMSKEEKASLMNGLKKADEIFLKKFESSVESSALTSVARTWTSTDSEEAVLAKAMSQSTIKRVSPVFMRTENAYEKGGDIKTDTVAVFPKSTADVSDATITLTTTVVKNPWTQDVTKATDSTSKSETVTAVDSEKKETVKNKRGSKRA